MNGYAIAQTSFIGLFPVIYTAGVPSAVDRVSVEPMSSSSLSVQWLCPEAVGTHDPILLDYQVIYYSSMTTQSMKNVAAIHTMEGENSCLLGTLLTGLEEDTTYSVKVRAVAWNVLGEAPVISAQATTFGQGTD